LKTLRQATIFRSIGDLLFARPNLTAHSFGVNCDMIFKVAFLLLASWLQGQLFEWWFHIRNHNFSIALMDIWFSP